MSQWVNQIPQQSDGSVPVGLRNRHTEMIVLPLHVEINTDTLLAAGLSVDDTTISLTAGHGATPGKILVVREGAYYYMGAILSFAVDVATMDTPLDCDFTTAAIVTVGDVNLAQNGSLGSPVFAYVVPPPAAEWDVTRIHVHIADDVVMDSAKFGGISGLANGVVLRAVNGTFKNIANIKSNGDLALTSSDYKYADKAPAGLYGFSSNHVFAGQEHVGVPVHLSGVHSDKLQIMVQDDLTALTSLQIIAIGHVVTD